MMGSDGEWWVVMVNDGQWWWMTGRDVRGHSLEVHPLLTKILDLPLGSDLAYGWRAGNLNWPIRIQQAGKILVSWRQVEIRQLLSLEMALSIYGKGFTISKTKVVGIKCKIWTILLFWASVLAPKMGHRRYAWQLACNSSRYRQVG